MKELVCLANTPFMAGDEAAVIAECPGFIEGDASQVVIDDPWWGIIPLTVVPYVAATYPTFNVWGQIMFDSTCRHFRCGTALWWGKVTAYVVPRGARVLVS